MSLGIGSAQDANFESALEGMCLGGDRTWGERTARNQYQEKIESTSFLARSTRFSPWLEKFPAGPRGNHSVGQRVTGRVKKGHYETLSAPRPSPNVLVVIRPTSFAYGPGGPKAPLFWRAVDQGRPSADAVVQGRPSPEAVVQGRSSPEAMEANVSVLKHLG